MVDPPEGSEVIEEWEFFYGLAQRMGLQLDIRGQKLDMNDKPTGHVCLSKNRRDKLLFRFSAERRSSFQQCEQQSKEE